MANGTGGIANPFNPDKSLAFQKYVDEEIKRAITGGTASNFSSVPVPGAIVKWDSAALFTVGEPLNLENPTTKAYVDDLIKEIKNILQLDYPNNAVVDAKVEAAIRTLLSNTNEIYSKDISTMRKALTDHIESIEVHRASANVEPRRIIKRNTAGNFKLPDTVIDDEATNLRTVKKVIQESPPVPVDVTDLKQKIATLETQVAALDKENDDLRNQIGTISPDGKFKGEIDITGLDAIRNAFAGDWYVAKGSATLFPTTIPVTYSNGDLLYITKNIVGRPIQVGDIYVKTSWGLTDAVKLASTQELTNKTMDGNQNTFTNLKASSFAPGELLTEARVKQLIAEATTYVTKI